LAEFVAKLAYELEFVQVDRGPSGPGDPVSGNGHAAARARIVRKRRRSQAAKFDGSAKSPHRVRRTHQRVHEL
jgi:hypothetical protein